MEIREELRTEIYIKRGNDRMKEMAIKSTRDIFNAVQNQREETGMQWMDFEVESGLNCNTVMKWGRRKNGCLTETVLLALKAVGLEMVIRPVRKEGETE